MRFARIRENRLLVTSNLVDGDLVPRIVRSIPKSERATRIVDLFVLAEKTAAVREFWSDYKKARERLLK